MGLLETYITTCHYYAFQNPLNGHKSESFAETGSLAPDNWVLNFQNKVYRIPDDTRWVIWYQNFCVWVGLIKILIVIRYNCFCLFEYVKRCANVENILMRATSTVQGVDDVTVMLKKDGDW